MYTWKRNNRITGELTRIGNAWERKPGGAKPLE
jgi:hypothetical protein